MISVCIATYKSEKTISSTLWDVLNQTYQDFEVIISDDNSQDHIADVIKNFKDKRIKFFPYYGEMLDCGANFQRCLSFAQGDIIFMLPAKARISKYTLEKYMKYFKDPSVGAITRPYFWFGDNLSHVVRAKERLPQDIVVSINDPLDRIISVFKTVDNSSAIAYRREYMKIPFNDTPFVEFTYPFADILKRHKVVLVSDYMMACPAFIHSHSQDSYIYKQSPMQNWIDMFNKIYWEEEWKDLRKGLIRNFIARNYIGVVQVRNYGTYLQFVREVVYLIKYRWMNIFNLNFWFFVLVSAIMPRKILKWLVKKAKENTRLNVSLADTA